jgi:hypothetical protein
MPEFMDVHHNMVGITAEALKEAHNADLAIQDDEKVVFKQAWADPENGVVYCLSEAQCAPLPSEPNPSFRAKRGFAVSRNASGRRTPRAAGARR